jgi:hypothetical protein
MIAPVAPVVPTRRDLARIFRAVEVEADVVLRENYLCCSSCAQAALDRDHPDRDVAFYHAQNTDTAAATGVLYLHFAAAGDDEERTRDLGNRLADALESHGLFLQWDGSPHQTIMLAVERLSFDVRGLGFALAHYTPEEHLLGPADREDGEGGEEDDGAPWAVFVWQEPEAGDPAQRWRALLANPDLDGEQAFVGETADEALAHAVAAYPSIRDDYEEDTLLSTNPFLSTTTPQGDA